MHSPFINIMLSSASRVATFREIAAPQVTVCPLFYLLSPPGDLRLDFGSDLPVSGHCLLLPFGIGLVALPENNLI